MSGYLQKIAYFACICALFMTFLGFYEYIISTVPIASRFGIGVTLLFSIAFTMFTYLFVLLDRIAQNMKSIQESAESIMESLDSATDSE